MRAFLFALSCVLFVLVSGKAVQVDSADFLNSQPFVFVAYVSPLADVLSHCLSRFQ